MLPHNKRPDGSQQETLGQNSNKEEDTDEHLVIRGWLGWYNLRTESRFSIQRSSLKSWPNDHIHSWSKPGNLVLDPMCGSGTTGKVALLAKREFVGIDISPEYIEIARQRLTESGLSVDVEHV